MAISRCFETTKERLDIIFKTKMIDPGYAKQYFQGMHPFMEMKTARTDVVSGCIKFLADRFNESYIDTSNFHIDITDNGCNIVCTTGRYSFPRIMITNYKSQYIVLEFLKDEKTKNFKYEDYQICNYAMIGLAEALSKYYNEVYYENKA